MNFESIYLSPKEMRRFLEIAGGDRAASNTPEEDALFREGLVRETMMVSADLGTGQSSVDMRAVVLSDLGREYYAQCMNQRKKDKQDSLRFWLATLIAAISAVIAFLEWLG